MSTVRRIAKNTAVLLVSNMVALVFRFFYVMVAARYLGAEGFGILSFAIAFGAIFGILADLGLAPLTTREVARERSLAAKYLGNIAVIKFFLAFVTFGTIVIAAYLLGYPEKTRQVVAILALATIGDRATAMLYAIFQAHEKMQYQSIGQIVGAALILVGTICAVQLDFDVVGFAWFYLAASWTTFLYAVIVCWARFVAPRLELDFRFWGDALRKAIPLGLTGIFITIYYYIDTVMLSLMKGQETVGLYNAAMRLLLVLLLIPTVYNTAIFPVMSRFYTAREGAAPLDFVWKRSVKYMLLLSVPVALGTTLLADRLIVLIFGPKYAESAIVLQVLIWSFVFASAGGVLGFLLNSINRQGVLTAATGTGACVNIVLNLLLIPGLGMVGAATATNLTRFIVIGIELVVLYKLGYFVGVREASSLVVRLLFASLVMGVFVVFAGELNLFLVVAVSAVLYVVVLSLTRAIDAEDWALLKRLVGRPADKSGEG
jgi:O-antigen/teichoic acid export membrane protein